jgi:hypothetical protein
MKLFCDGVEFPAKVSPYMGGRPAEDADNEIPMFEAIASTPFPHDAKWELEMDGTRLEMAIRTANAMTDHSSGIYSALFTAPAVG